MALAPLKLRKELTAKHLVREIPVTGWLYTGTLSPDGRKLLLGRHAGIDVVDLASGEIMTVTIPGAQHDAISQIQFTPDGSRVIAALWIGAVAVLEWPSLDQVALHPIAPDRMHGLAVMPDGASAWVGGHDEKRTRIDLDTGKVLASKGGESMWMSSAVLAPDASVLVTSDAATNVRLCDPQTGAERTKLERLGIAHNMVCRGGELLVPSLTVSVVDLATGETRRAMTGEHKLGAQTAVFLDENIIASGGAHDPLLVIWRPEPLVLKPYKKGAIEKLIVMPDGEHLLVVPRFDNPLQLWRIAGFRSLD